MSLGKPPTIADVYDRVGELDDKVDLVLRSHERRIRVVEQRTVKIAVTLSGVIAIGAYLANLLITKLRG